MGGSFFAHIKTLKVFCLKPDKPLKYKREYLNMKAKIDQIKSLLEELEDEAFETTDEINIKNFDALEIPSVISEIVDYLQPLLTAYEMAVYYYLFRNSLLNSGEPYARASTRGMQNIIQSHSGQSSKLSYKAVQKSIEGLIEKKAISRHGDTQREGSLYRIFIPEEIEACQNLMKLEQDVKSKEVNIKKDLDYYNIKENRLKIFERDSYKCHYCEKQLTRFSATLDHIQPVSKGGSNSFDNLVTSCLHCNSERGNSPVSDFISKKGEISFEK